MDVIHTVKVNKPIYPGQDGVWVIHDQLNARRIMLDDSQVPPSIKESIGLARAAFFHARWINNTWELQKKVKWRYW